MKCNTFTKIYLCALGQYDYDAVPAVPPEIVLFPNWFYFNIYEISSWSRAILVPLSIIYAKKPFKKLRRSRESMSSSSAVAQNANLHLSWDKKNPISAGGISSCSPTGWSHWFERVHIRPLRKMAIKQGGEVDAGAL